MTLWTELIADIVGGRWVNPETGQPAQVPYDSIHIAETLESEESTLLESVGLQGHLVLVCDPTTYEALGRRVEANLSAQGAISRIVLEHPHADLQEVERLRRQVASFSGVVAVGSGTINDLCKHATQLNGQRYAVFATAGSMNGYTSTTASMRLESGLKVSLPSHAPAGVFVDLQVSADAPAYLSASGFGDCLCRSVAQVDWWLSHRLLGTAYHPAAYVIQERDELSLNERVSELPAGDVEAVGFLHRLLTLGGLATAFTGVSNSGSMGEHQISHYIDCFAGAKHPGTLHGQQVGVASLTMARLQRLLLSQTQPPRLLPTRIDAEGMRQRMGSAVADQCRVEFEKKAFSGEGLERLNARLAEIWSDLREEVRPFILAVEEMESMLRASGGPATPQELGVEADFYREAVVHCREMRNRFSFLDIAADAGMLEDFAAEEVR
jgi:glycerol-1-phosphate dehydrogenase [NAD(P)+]